VDSPISLPVDIGILRGSGNPQGRQLADVFSGLTDLKTGLSSIEKKVSDPTNLFPPAYLREVVVQNLSPVRRSRNDLDFIFDNRNDSFLDCLEKFKLFVQGQDIGNLDNQGRRELLAAMCSMRAKMADYLSASGTNKSG
jgi:hypothetical protein